MTAPDDGPAPGARTNARGVEKAQPDASRAPQAPEARTQEESPNRPRIITLCGSTRFREAFEEWLGRLSLDGAIVLTVMSYGYWLEVPLNDQEMDVARRVHRHKIQMSDEIFVLDVGGYVGASTEEEIAIAHRAGVRVRYLSEVAPEWTIADRRFRHRDP